MKKTIIIFLLFFISFYSFSQINSVGYDTAIAETFDLLNGKPFAEIQLEDTSGQLFHTSSLLGKTIYVDFWFTLCSPCVKEIPFSKSLQSFFDSTNDLIFLSICIENKERKQAWKDMVKEKVMPGIQLFYELNRPQKINLLREFKVSFPTYLLVNKDMKVIGYDAPRPSQEGFVHWSIAQATQDILLSESYKQMMYRTSSYLSFINANKERILSLRGKE